HARELRKSEVPGTCAAAPFPRERRGVGHPRKSALRVRFSRCPAPVRRRKDAANPPVAWGDCGKPARCPTPLTDTVDVSPDFDPLAEAFARDPHAVWARLREGCPVARGARWGFWALTRYDDIVAASSRPGDFSSAQGI